MNESTLRPVISSIPATRSSRIVVWNLRRIVTTSSVSPSATKRCSALVIVSWVRHTIRLSRIAVRAFVGPRPVYSANSRTTCRLTSAASDPPGGRFCASVLATPASQLIPLWGTAARKTEGNGENPTDGFRHPEAYREPTGLPNDAPSERKKGAGARRAENKRRALGCRASRPNDHAAEGGVRA